MSSGEEWKDQDDQDPSEELDQALQAIMGGGAIPPGAQFDRDKLVEKIARRFDITEDELNVLFKDDEKLVEYYNEVLLKAKTIVAEELTDADPVDGYQLTERNKSDLAVLADDDKRRADRAAKIAAKKALIQAKLDAQKEELHRRQTDPDYFPPDASDFIDGAADNTLPDASDAVIPDGESLPPTEEQQKQTHEELQKTLPKEIQVSWEDVQAAMRSLFDGEEET